MKVQIEMAAGVEWERLVVDGDVLEAGQAMFVDGPARRVDAPAAGVFRGSGHGPFFLEVEDCECGRFHAPGDDGGHEDDRGLNL